MRKSKGFGVSVLRGLFEVEEFVTGKRSGWSYRQVLYRRRYELAILFSAIAMIQLAVRVEEEVDIKLLNYSFDIIALQIRGSL